MNHLIATLLLLAGGAVVEFQVTTVDDRVATGTVQHWDDQSIVLEAEDGGTQELSLRDVLRVDLARNINAPLQVAPGEVSLVDSSRIVVEEFTASDGRARFVLPASLRAEDGKIEAPLEAVRSVRLMEMPTRETSVVAEWRELLAMQTAGDLIVIRKPGAENLNFVEGTLGDVSTEAVEFTLDEQTLQVKRSKVFGLIYYRNATDDGNAPTAIVNGPDVRLPAREVALSGESLVVTTGHLGVVRLPLSAVRSVDYSIDRLQYLSDLEPARLDWTPAPGTASTGQLFSSIARDRAFYAPELTLEYPPNSLPVAEIGSSGLTKRATFAKGLALRSRIEIVYRVPRGFPTFRATAGIDPMTRTTGAVELVVLGDDKPLFCQIVVGNDAPVEIECDVAGVRELTLLVDYGPDAHFGGGLGDNLHLGGARFTK